MPGYDCLWTEEITEQKTHMYMTDHDTLEPWRSENAGFCTVWGARLWFNERLWTASICNSLMLPSSRGEYP
jgi:hypothetical protein